MTIRLYARCSTNDQSVESQRPGLEQWVCIHAPQSPTRWYEDAGYTGTNVERPAFGRLMKEVKAGDTVLCYAVDRVTRQGIIPTLQLRLELKAKDVKLVSVSEPWMSDDNPAAEIVTAVLAWAAAQERQRLQARQRAGIEARRDPNKKCPWGGRRAGTRIKVTIEKEKLVLMLHREQTPVRRICRLVGLSPKTVYAVLARHTPPAP